MLKQIVARREDISLDGFKDDLNNILPIGEMPSDFFDELKLEDLIGIDDEINPVNNEHIPDFEIHQSNYENPTVPLSMRVQGGRQRKRKAEKIDEETEISNEKMFKILQNTSSLICERKIMVKFIRNSHFKLLSRFPKVQSCHFMKSQAP
jgi:hypothetical protein